MNIYNDQTMSVFFCFITTPTFIEPPDLSVYNSNNLNYRKKISWEY